MSDYMVGAIMGIAGFVIGMTIASFSAWAFTTIRDRWRDKRSGTKWLDYIRYGTRRKP